MLDPPIPELPPGVVAILATVGPDGPVAIPVSALRRTARGRLLVGLARTRGSTARLRADPRCAVSLNAPGTSLCIEGVARVAADPLPGLEGMVAFEIAARRVRDARGPATEVDGSIPWHWTTDEAAARHRAVLAALAGLAGLAV